MPSHAVTPPGPVPGETGDEHPTPAGAPPATATERAQALARRRKAQLLALILADRDKLTDPAGLIDESPLFWETVAAFATARAARSQHLGAGTRVGPPTTEADVQAVIEAVRRIRRDREIQDPQGGGQHGA